MGDDGQPLVEVARKMKAIRYAAINQRYGKKTWYHAICRTSPRKRHQDPPKGRWCQRNGQEVSTFLVSHPHAIVILCLMIIHRLDMMSKDSSPLNHIEADCSNLNIFKIINF